MNIVHINKYDVRGGAAIAMNRLHRELLRHGEKSRLLVAHSVHNDRFTTSFYSALDPMRSLTGRIKDNLMRRVAKIEGSERYDNTHTFLLPYTNIVRNADIINLHNLHDGFFNIGVISHLARRKPVVWTLHDMWPLTGHCAYSYDCERWKYSCHHCPLLEASNHDLVEPSPTKRDRTKRMWMKKRSIYRGVSLHIVAPSLWLVDIAKEGILSCASSISHIPNGVNLESFYPLSKDLAREALGLPRSRFILYISSTGHKRKGIEYLLSALESIPMKDSITLLTAGNDDRSLSLSPGITRKHFGRIDNVDILRIIYSASDLTILPTLADNHPLVGIESLACGTPLVGFAVGGVPEIIRPGITGYLAKPENAMDLAANITRFMNNRDIWDELRFSSRKVAKEEYSIDMQVSKYLALYNKLISRH